MKLIEEIDKLRKLSNESISSLARKADVTPAALSKFLSGKSDIGGSKLVRVLEDLGVSVRTEIIAKLKEKAGFSDPDISDLGRDLAFLFENIDDINKKIILTTFIKALSRNKDLQVKESLSRINRRVSML